MRYILFLFSLLLANTASAIDCDTAPTCEELGYSTEEDPYCAENGYMYCPLDHSYKKCVNMDCAKLGFSESDKTSWCSKLIKCKGNPLMTLCQNLCEIGDVYYADGTCGYAQDYDPDNKAKIPVGVVFYTYDEGRHGKVIAFNDVPADREYTFFPPNSGHSNEGAAQDKDQMPFGTLIPDELSVIEPDKLVESLKSGKKELFDGKGNTKTILASPNLKLCHGKQKSDPDYPYYCQATAAIQTNLYYPNEHVKNDPLVGQGQWYIPALYEVLLWNPVDINQMQPYKDYDNSGALNTSKTKIEESFKLLQAKGVSCVFPKLFYPTSTFISEDNPYFASILGSRTWDSVPYAHSVRAILAF